MITQKKIRELPTYEHKSYKKGCGNGLFIWVGKNYRGVDGEMYGGKKYFKGRYKDSEIQIGIFGNRHGEMKLDEAQCKWNDIKQWSKDTGQKVGMYKKHLQKKIDLDQYTFGEVVNMFLLDKESDIKPTTFREYKRQLEDHILANLNFTTPLHELEWDKGGRQTIKKVLEKIKKNTNGHGVEQARRCENLLSQTFKFAISEGWMRRGQNPVDEDKKKKASEKQVDHHPTYLVLFFFHLLL